MTGRVPAVGRIPILAALLSLASSAAAGPCAVSGPLNLEAFKRKSETTYDGAFQRAIDSAANCGGGVVQVPTGTFPVTVPIQLRSDVRIQGGGERSLIAFPQGGTGRFRVNMAKRVEFEGLAFEFMGAAGGSQAIVSDTASFGARKLKVRNCRFYNCGIHLVGITDKDGHWGSFADIVGNEFEGRLARILLSGWRLATVTGNTVSAQDLPGANNNVSGIRCENRSSDILIANNTVHGCTQNGIQVFSGSNVLVSGNLTFGNLQSGIGVNTDGDDFPQGVAIATNVCRNNAYDGIDVNTPRGADLGLTVSGNVCTGNGKTGIYVAGARGVSLTGNVCDRNGNTGIFLNRVRSVSLSANYLRSNNSVDHPKDSPGDKNGLTVQDGEECTVTGNVSGNLDADSSQHFGIAILGNSRRNAFVGNVLRGNRISPFLRPGKTGRPPANRFQANEPE